MSAAEQTLVKALDDRVLQLVDACTQCGACVEACPMPAHTGLDSIPPKNLITGVTQWLKSSDGPEPARRWAEVCTGSGHCIDACPEDINPRFLLTMARRTFAKMSPPETRRERGRTQFKKMSRGVGLLSRLQLPPMLLERLSPSSHPGSMQSPEVVFYTGCNLLKTPHIGLLCLDVLDRLEVSYEVHGGPGMCCGILQMRGGDDANSLRQGTRSLARFAETGTQQVLSWCPTCQLQFSETTLPVQASPSPFDLTMFPVYLADQLERLRPHLRKPIPKRIALHEHPGTPGVVDAVHRLLGAVQGIEIVELSTPKIGYSLTALAAVPEIQSRLLAEELQLAADAQVDTLVTIFHTEHRELAVQAQGVPFEIANYMEIVGNAMGVHQEDTYQRLQAMGEVDAVLEASMKTLVRNGVDMEEAREAIADMLADHILSPPSLPAKPGNALRMFS